MTSSDLPPQAQAETTVSLPVRLSPRGDYLKDADNQTLADLRYHTAHTEAKELIVRAVNCHAELLDALKRCDNAFVAWQVGQIPGRPEDILDLIIRVRTAIAKAEGRP